MPCDLLNINNPTTFYFASYDFSLQVKEDLSSCVPHALEDEIRGFLFDFGLTFTCEHIRGLGVTCYVNSNFVSRINYVNLISSFGDVNTTPTFILVDMGEITDLDTNADTDNIACPYFAQIPELIRDNLFCTTTPNDFSEGFAIASYNLYYAGIEGDGWYWVFLWQQGVPPNNIFQNIRCIAYYNYYTRNLTNGLLAGGGGTWVFGNTRQSCIPLPHFSHFVPIMYVHTCARMFSRAPYTNTKEDYETLTGLFVGDEFWESQFDVDTIKKMLITRTI